MTSHLHANDQSSDSLKQMLLFFNLSIRKLAIVGVSFPLVTLFICLVSAYIFQYDDVHETHCQVFNVIPSISAITGITPQTYLWRIAVAFHVGPRMVIAQVYYNYFISKISKSDKVINFILIHVCYWLNMIEIVTICGVTYISNRENYPIHEKLFILFMLSSLLYMIVMIKTFGMVHKNMTDFQFKSYKIKKILFGICIASTITLILFFIKHRFYCHDLAFTWFALSEYILAVSNMAFHFTITLDFPNEKLIVAKDFPLLKMN
ncbi:post-GPI attachment to proteins factor 2-like [Daktulosphaira vitifoliae]|uniref:post-GPI attachment to proteins factor 2-like n=1 Tax=Daktulosphaira vitifoliae TaxID=58002 RepID=UPI0021A9B931|nr:post-GPI attachment to proteins factor 2-like [Daktulosphaira vitifoliae]